MDVGVVGAGVMGQNHIRVYSELKSVDRVLFYDVDPKKMQDLSKYYNKYDVIVASDTFTDLVQSVDAISICVPTQFHRETVKKIIDINKHLDLLIEKPLCNSYWDTLYLSDILENIDSIIGVGHIERFNPIIPELTKIIKDPLYVEFKRHNPSSSRISDVDVVTDLMIHDIDIMRELFFRNMFDDIYGVYASGNNDICDTIIKTDFPIHLSASRKSSKKIRSIYIETEEFTIDADYMSQEITIYSKPERFNLNCGTYKQENMVEKVLVKKMEPLKEELSTFVNCSLYHKPFPVSIQDAIDNLDICREILECM